MRLVAFHAGRDIPVLLVMTHAACNLRMLARVCLDFLVHFSVAVTAGIVEVCTHRNLLLGCVWLTVAVHADRECVTVELAVASFTLRHDLFPVLFSWVIGMKFRMTLCAFQLMFAALVLDLGKNRIVTASAFGRGEGFDIHFVE